MKEIVLVRHAKSSWKFNVSDKNRPIKKKGIIDATLVSSRFKNFEPSIDVVFSSPAKRALSTCKIFIENLQINEDLLIISEDLYDFEGENVMSFIKNMNDNYKSVMIFGHNHAFTRLVNLLGDQYIDNLPTCGLVSIKFNIQSWRNVTKGVIELILFPKTLNV